MNASTTLENALRELQLRKHEAQERENKLGVQLQAARTEREHADAAIEHIMKLTGQVAEDGTRENAERIADLNRRTAPGAPAGMDAVEAALKRSPVPLTLEQLTAAVAELGWHPNTDEPERAVRAAASRLRAKRNQFVYASKKWAYLPNHFDQLATNGTLMTEEP